MYRSGSLLLVLASFVLGYALRDSYDRSKTRSAMTERSGQIDITQHQEQSSPVHHQEAGESAMDPSTDQSLAVKIQVQQSIVRQIEQDLKKLGAYETDQIHLKELASSLNAIQAESQRLDQQMGALKSQAFQSYAEKDRSFQAAQLNQESEIVALRERISKQAQLIQKAKNTLKEAEISGFLTDEVRNIQTQLPIEQNILARLQQQLRTLRMQAGTASSVYKRNQQWEQEEDRTRLRNEYAEKSRELALQQQKIQKEYQTLLAQIPERIETRLELQTRYDHELNKLTALQNQSTGNS